MTRQKQFRLESHTGGVTALLLGTLLWSTAYIVVKDIVGTLPPSSIVLGRFAIAALCFLPWLRLKPGLMLAGAELGCWLIGGYGTQTLGLQYTTAGRSAFIASLCVILVPLLLGLIGRRIAAAAWVAAALALVGIALLSYQGGRLNVGDLWSLGTAVCWAGHIIRLERFAQRYPTLPLTAIQIWSMTALSLGWAAFDQGMGQPTAVSAAAVPWGWLVYLGLFTTALPTWLQTFGQMRVSPPEAVILFTLEPVAAVILAFFLLGESLTDLQILGAILIIVATYVSQLPSRASRLG
ncbi:MAG: DMT family transporter [Cyanobacteria bacterium Co-bin13]|nr:DMT family transporter [Cyanobacteria bacterium Co-bin13]